MGSETQPLCAVCDYAIPDPPAVFPLDDPDAGSVHTCPGACADAWVAGRDAAIRVVEEHHGCTDGADRAFAAGLAAMHQAESEGNGWDDQ